MTSKNLLMALFVFLFAVSITTQAQECKSKKEVKKECSSLQQSTCGSEGVTCGSHEPKVNGENKVEIWNKVCPVKGEPVDPKAPTYTYKGKTYGFCCKGCDTKFKADPEKYINNLSKDGKTFVGKK